jgi:quercetin dioxygenase-like cupin family protein
MTYLLELGGGQCVPDHTHDHEEVPHLVSGRWTVTIAGEDTELRPGDTAVIPARVVPCLVHARRRRGRDPDVDARRHADP